MDKTLSVPQILPYPKSPLAENPLSLRIELQSWKAAIERYPVIVGFAPEGFGKSLLIEKLINYYCKSNDFKSLHLLTDTNPEESCRKIQAILHLNHSEKLLFLSDEPTFSSKELSILTSLPELKLNGSRILFTQNKALDYPQSENFIQISLKGVEPEWCCRLLENQLRICHKTMPPGLTENKVYELCSGIPRLIYSLADAIIAASEFSPIPGKANIEKIFNSETRIWLKQIFADYYSEMKKTQLLPLIFLSPTYAIELCTAEQLHNPDSFLFELIDTWSNQKANQKTIPAFLTDFLHTLFPESKIKCERTRFTKKLLKMKNPTETVFFQLFDFFQQDIISHQEISDFLFKHRFRISILKANTEKWHFIIDILKQNTEEPTSKDNLQLISEFKYPQKKSDSPDPLIKAFLDYQNGIKLHTRKKHLPANKLLQKSLSFFAKQKIGLLYNLCLCNILHINFYEYPEKFLAEKISELQKQALIHRFKKLDFAVLILSLRFSFLQNNLEQSYINACRLFLSPEAEHKLIACEYLSMCCLRKEKFSESLLHAKTTEKYDSSAVSCHNRLHYKWLKLIYKLITEKKPFSPKNPEFRKQESEFSPIAAAIIANIKKDCITEENKICSAAEREITNWSVWLKPFLNKRNKITVFIKKQLTEISEKELNTLRQKTSAFNLFLDFRADFFCRNNQILALSRRKILRKMLLILCSRPEIKSNLKQLFFLVWPHQKFDPDCDSYTVRTSINRLRKIIHAENYTPIETIDTGAYIFHPSETDCFIFPEYE